MKIRLIPAKGNAIILGDDANRVLIRNYSPDLPAALEIIRFFNSDYPEIIPHGYNPNVRSWITDRIHKSEAEAFLFAEQHPGQVFQSATLEISEDGGTVYLPATRNTVKLIERTGLTTIFQYSFLCQAVTLNNTTIK